MSEFMPIPPTHAVADPQVRSVLDALSRNVQITIDSIQATATVEQTPQVGGATTFGSPSSVTNITNLGGAYTVQNLKDDLISGAVTVVAGARSSDSIIKTAATYMSFQHKDASILGTTAAYTGDFRTALGITSTGIIGGYNNKTTGAWTTTLALEAATGNLTVLGTIRANSIIQVGAYLGSSTVSTVLSNISSAQSDASYAATEVANKLDKSGGDILSGAITFTSAGGFKTGTISIDGSGNVTGAGVAFTSKGIVGRNASNTTFTIDASTGAATFKGDITGASGTFTGNVDCVGSANFSGNFSSGQLLALPGGVYYVYPSSYAQGTTATTGTVRTSIFGRTANTSALWNVGVIGTGDGSTTGIGVVGAGGLYGGYFGTSNATGSGLQAYNTGGGTALWLNGGTLKYGSITVGVPDGGTDKYLRNDGTWAAVSALGGGTITSVSGSGTVGGITLGGSSSSGAANLTLTGTPSFAASAISSGTVATARLASGTASSSSYLRGDSTWVTSIPLSAISLSGANIVASLSGSSGSTSGVTNVSFSGSLTGGATGTVSWSMGSSSAAVNINVSSDSRLKKNVQDIPLGLSFVNQLRPVSYQWDHECYAHYGEMMDYGFIAQEVEAIVGTGTSMVGDIQDGPLAGYKYFGNGGIVAALVKSVQELSAKVAQLEANNA